MKKLFVLGAGVLLFAFAACNKKDNGPDYDPNAQYDIDSAKIVAYIQANNIQNVQHDSRGLFYQIVKPGGEQKPNGVASVKVGYTGTLLDKSKFDGKDTAYFDLNKVITGWTVGIPKIGKDGEINLFVPSIYGYGPYANGPIPPNSVLVFNVKLYDFVNK
ncbi:FKBP-type peptidyl-prolyl cis-trans isomerase FkpA [Chitinophaga terrae (ex Kim and Jung 2007)]|jgi:FKBP-type peptidyl-prolyl cis-trans isomerase|uniref:Peptidyl-prolyl cis-trans isomerase n=1 Tax=Chitinophaga terrae (ex Kim and Jung 2007) TaxID=408074 RepID=A0A1H3WYN0_9BACT|nr:FKBP-type peptidyl-prolyl cis-trans isomerase [Chitinophaga terrae (ex Kim and Jung 2007)]MDQ0106981.1 FKBP-type peptidyl-prolyl cis-trans isomerase [Chitinophaga terrae (ex Kim and Jung 2007)]GEP90227.1 peptidyl-prolyl cis-trans isomerase [Chitinophaga terrae (ex Kim and Jung 2007)]SDZ92307.1 FKBP-type peptidyl-prolyl cis-trans isomerase FkpA [Chitinophaga terrae (ex Kim and Jung 2007)]